MKSKRYNLNNYLFYMIVILLAFLVYTVDGVFSNIWVILTNMLILILSLVFMVVGDKYNYSLNKLFMVFSFFFYGIAPILQYQNGRTIWGGPGFDDYSYIKMNIIIVFILISYQALYFIFTRLQSKRITFVHKRENYAYAISWKMLIVLSTMSLFITLYYNNFNIINLLIRAGGDVDRVSLKQSVRLIYSNFIRPIPVISLVFFKLYNIKNKKAELILLIIALLSNFPTSRARFYIAAIYIPLAIIYLKSINKKYLLFNKIIIIGLLFAFPFLDQARRVNSLTDFQLKLDFRMFLDGHFDSYQMFMRVVNADYTTMGNQLLSSILFFIPRSIWPNKSIGSGALMSQQLGLTFDNISMNYFGEGYINFGYIGIIMFVILISYLNAKLDKSYWKNYTINNWMSPYYLFFLGLEFFILRGDLLSSIAFTSGLMAAVYFVQKLSLRKS